jgi:hypothetical protein
MLLISGNCIPTSCSNCPYTLLSVNDYKVCGLGASHVSSCEKPQDCPIIGRIPDEHGRILDETDVINAIHKRIEVLMHDEEFRRKHGHIDMYGLIPMIFNLPEIIEELKQMP